MGLLKLVTFVAALFVANAFAPAAWAPVRQTTALRSIMDAGSPAKAELEEMKTTMKARLDKKLEEMLAEVQAEAPAAAADGGLSARLDNIESMLSDLKKAVA